MKKNELCVRQLLSAVLLSVLMLSVMPAMAQLEEQSTVEASKVQADAAQVLRERYPDASIQSSEAAHQALAEVKQIRARINARYIQDSRLCYPKFFTNYCLNKAKDRQREDLTVIRPVEIQANAYNRKQRVVERDRRLVEKAAKEAGERREKQILMPSAPAVETEKNAVDTVEKTSQRKARAKQMAKKRAAFADAQRQREEEAPAEAAMRAENAKKYETKVQEYKTRQREMAKMQAEKAQENHDKAP